MRDVIVTPFAPVLGGGGRLRTYAVTAALASLRPVDVVFGRFGGNEPSEEYRVLDGVTFTAVERSPVRRRLVTSAASLVRDGAPPSWARAVWPGLAPAAVACAEQHGDARLIADGPVAAAALMGVMGQREVVYLAHNLESGFRHQLADVGAAHHRRIRRFEQQILRRASESWMVSEQDAAGARELAPEAPLLVVPNAVDVDAIVPVEPPAGAAIAIMVADFEYEPNRHGLRMMLDEVMPELWRTVPHACLRVVGRGLERVQPPDPRVRFAGFVPHLPSAYAHAACAVVPLRHGGGSPLKFIEALAYGLPVVSTSYAAAGLDVEPGEHYLAADDPVAFAAAMAAAFDGTFAAGAARGRALAEERYSVGALTELLSGRAIEERRDAVSA